MVSRLVLKASLISSFFLLRSSSSASLAAARLATASRYNRVVRSRSVSSGTESDVPSRTAAIGWNAAGTGESGTGLDVGDRPDTVRACSISAFLLLSSSIRPALVPTREVETWGESNGLLGTGLDGLDVFGPE
jgi:hypothetical protein